MPTLKRLLLASVGRLGLVVLGLLLAEGAARVVLGLSGAGASTAETRAAGAAIIGEMTELLPRIEDDGAGGSDEAEAATAVERAAPPGRFLHPYVGWETPRAMRIVERELARRSDRDDYDIWVVGGSVAAMFANEAVGGVTVLTETLAEDPALEGRAPRVVNFGHGSFKQPQQLNLVVYLLTLLPPPDLVINLDGFNEVALGMQNAIGEVHPVYPGRVEWGTLARSALVDSTSFEQLARVRGLVSRASAVHTRADEWGLYRSALLGYCVHRVLDDQRREFAVAQLEYSEHLAASTEQRLRGPDLPSDEALAGYCVHAWETTSRALHALLTDRGVRYLHVLQPTLHDEGSKPPTSEELEKGRISPAWRRGVEEGYPLMRKAGTRLASHGVPFFDATGVFADHEETLYVDSCHFGARGNKILAQAVADRLLDAD